MTRFTDGIRLHYGKKYDEMDVSVEDMKGIALAFAVRWDIQEHGKLSTELKEALKQWGE